MPITCPFEFHNLNKNQFDEIDRVVMGCAFETQNEIGRLCDEHVYENVLASRLRTAGLKNVQTQLPVSVTSEGFEMVYRLDLFVDHALYELKTVSVLTSGHDAQALHYAMMLSINHVKLLNFRSPRVQGRLRFNVLLAQDRRLLNWDDSDWRQLSSECNGLRQRLRHLLDDWGPALESRLYENALIHFSGGEASCVNRVPLTRSGVEVGTHIVNSHADNIGFVVTGLSDPRNHRSHLERLIRMLRLYGIQWFNVGRRTAEAVTILR